MHKACPDCVEVMKWSFPHFDYPSSHDGGSLCSMAAFRSHCVGAPWTHRVTERFAFR
ncbi:MAG: hypothetical protein SGJ09_14470 [Phycisphaerae bacterium]|nr:hypothetical protein [Phycisphaerae bacterium]